MKQCAILSTEGREKINLPGPRQSVKAYSGLTMKCKPIGGRTLQTVNYFQDDTQAF